jgi:hypothetical protein
MSRRRFPVFIYNKFTRYSSWNIWIIWKNLLMPFKNVWISKYSRGDAKGGKNRRAREHCSQEMLNSCRKFVWMKICYWKFEGNLNSHVPLWAQQHMVDRHYSLNLKPWLARTLYVYAHAYLAQKYSVGLQEILSPGCAPRNKIIFSCLGRRPRTRPLWWVSLF